MLQGEWAAWELEAVTQGGDRLQSPGKFSVRKGSRATEFSVAALMGAQMTRSLCLHSTRCSQVLTCSVVAKINKLFILRIKHGS